MDLNISKNIFLQAEFCQWVPGLCALDPSSTSAPLLRRPDISAVRQSRAVPGGSAGGRGFPWPVCSALRDSPQR